MLLADRRAVVTGAGGNLGRSVVRAFLAEGARLVAVTHSVASNEMLADVVASAGDKCTVLRADVTREDEVAELRGAAADRLGGVELLVNLVGGFQFGKNLWEIELADWDRMMDLNLRSAFLCCRAFVPGMIQGGYGRIVNVSSRAAFNIKSRRGAYNVAKSAVAALTQVLREELKGTGVTACAVAPGTIDTEPNRQSMPKADPSKWVSPDHLAQGIAYLCSDAGGLFSGGVLPVYGDE